MSGSLCSFICRPWLAHRGVPVLLVFAALTWICVGSFSQATAQEPQFAPAEPQRNVLIELYVREGQPESAAAVAAAEKIAESRSGLQLVKRVVSDNPDAQARLKSIADFFHFDPESTPVVYGCGRAIRTGASAEEFETLINEMLTLEVFTQAGCPHCDSAHEYLNDFLKHYPGLRVVYRSISEDSANRVALDNLSRELRTAVPETPVFHLCNQLLVGFDPAQFSGDHLREVLKKWTIDNAPESAKVDQTSDQEPASSSVQRFTTIN